MAGIARDLDRMVDANRGNPNALMQRTPPPAAGGSPVSPDLLKLLALQALKAETEAKENELKLTMSKQPGTIAKQRSAEAQSRALGEVTEAVTGVKANQQQNAAKRQQQMLGGRPGPSGPPGAPPGPPGAPPRQMAGIAGQPPPNMARMAGGGIVGSQGSGKEAQAANLLSSIGMAPPQFKALPVSEQQRIGATLRTRRMANGGIVSFQQGGGIKASDEQLKVLGISPAVWAGMTKEAQAREIRNKLQKGTFLSTGLENHRVTGSMRPAIEAKDRQAANINLLAPIRRSATKVLAAEATKAREAQRTSRWSPEKRIAMELPPLAQTQADAFARQIVPEAKYSQGPLDGNQGYKVSEKTTSPQGLQGLQATFQDPTGTQRGKANIANRDVFMEGAKKLTGGAAYDPLLKGLGGIKSDTSWQSALLRSPGAQSSALGRIGSAFQRDSDREVAEKAAKLGTEASIIDAKKKSQGTGITAGRGLTGDVSKELYDAAKGSALAQQVNIEATISRETNRIKGLNLVNMDETRKLIVMKDINGLISGAREFYDKLMIETLGSTLGWGKLKGDALKAAKKTKKEAIAFKRDTALKPLIAILDKIAGKVVPTK